MPTRSSRPRRGRSGRVDDGSGSPTKVSSVGALELVIGMPAAARVEADECTPAAWLPSASGPEPALPLVVEEVSQLLAGSSPSIAEASATPPNDL